jgi:voltage-gated potassium channel Kch
MRDSPSRVQTAFVTVRHGIHTLAEYQWFLISGGFLLVILFGMVGFWLAYQARAVSPSLPDLFYFSLQLFALQSGAQVPVNSIFLEIARFLAPLISFYVIVSVIFILIQQFRLFVFNLIPSRHVVVCGLGYLGPEIVRYYQDTMRVIVIESDPLNKEIETCKDYGAVVIIGDATNENILRKAAVQKAQDVFIVAGKDTTNAKIASMCKKILDETEGNEVQCHIHFLNPDLSRAFFPLAFFSKIKSRCRMEFFNLYLISGYCIQKLYPPFTERDVANGKAHVLILGTGKMGEELITRTIKRWITKKTGTPITITCIDRIARDKEQYFHGHYPALADHCKLTMIQTDLTSKDFLTGSFLEKIPADPPVGMIYLCIDNAEISIHAAITLARMPLLKGIPVVVRSIHADGLTRIFTFLAQNNPELSHIRTFPLVSNDCSKPLIIGGMREILAAAIHDHYRALRATQNSYPADDPSMKPWHELDEDFKQSNRKQAYHIYTKLQEVNCGLEPLILWDEPLFEFTPDEVEKLAELEHIRWIEERIAMGWKSGSKNKELKTTPWLIPYSQLPEYMKEFDREPVRNIPALLARIDLKVVRIREMPGR